MHRNPRLACPAGSTRRARRGSVFVEFWFFFICWLALAGVSIQMLLTVNRQMCLNNMAFLAGRAHMSQPKDNKGDNWVGYVRAWHRNFQIENRYLNYWTSYEHKNNQISNKLSAHGQGVLLTDNYPQRWAGLIRMAYPLGTVNFLGLNNYPYTVKVNSWAYTPRSSLDEEKHSETKDNDNDDYDGWQSMAATLNTMIGWWNTASGLFP